MIAVLNKPARARISTASITTLLAIFCASTASTAQAGCEHLFSDAANVERHFALLDKLGAIPNKPGDSKPAVPCSGRSCTNRHGSPLAPTTTAESLVGPDWICLIKLLEPITLQATHRPPDSSAILADWSGPSIFHPPRLSDRSSLIAAHSRS